MTFESRAHLTAKQDAVANGESSRQRLSAPGRPTALCVIHEARQQVVVSGYKALKATGPLERCICAHKQISDGPTHHGAARAT